MVHGGSASRGAVRGQRDPAGPAQRGLHEARARAPTELECHVGRDAAGAGGLAAIYSCRYVSFVMLCYNYVIVMLYHK